MPLPKIIAIVYFVLLVLIGNVALAEQQDYIISLNPQLNNSDVIFESTLQDGMGYIWMSYSDGVVKYDGKLYTQISNKEIFPGTTEKVKYITKDNTSTIWALSHNGILSYLNERGEFSVINKIQPNKVQIIQPKEDKIWLATKKGKILCYQSNQLQVDSITTIPGIEQSKFGITGIQVDSNKNVFVSTDFGKIFEYSLTKQELQELRGPHNNTVGTVKIIFDSYDRLWIGTEGMGLLCYCIKDEEFISPPLLQDNQELLKNELFMSLFSDSTGVIWAGTDGGGLFKIDLEGNKIKHYQHKKQNQFSLNSNTILHISEDGDKNIWVTNSYGGVNVILPKNEWIHYHEGTANNTPVKVLTSLRTSDGKLWVGTEGQGITVIDPARGTSKQFLSAEKLNKNFYIFKIVEDKKGNLWIGTYKNGLWYYDSSTKTFSAITNYKDKSQIPIDIRFLYKDSEGRIWAATNLGIYAFSDDKKQIVFFENNTHGLDCLICESIEEDYNHRLWFGFINGGLFQLRENRMNIYQSNFSKHQFIETKETNDSRDNIFCMDSDQEGNLWLINKFGNLFKYNAENVNPHSQKAVLKDLSFKALAVENSNSIWLSSSHGIWHYHPKDSTLFNYTMVNGLHSNKFQRRSVNIDSKGYIYFGGVNGLNYFLPQEVKSEIHKPQLYVNKIEILNQAAKNIIPDQIISSTEHIKELQLSYKQSSFSFQFSVITPPVSNNYKYIYRLKGFDKKWIEAKNDQIATYTNIFPGAYTFEVKAGSMHGNWNIPAKKINIVITPPWYLSIWAYIAYSLIFALIVYGFYVWVKLKNKLEIEEKERQHERDLYDFKLDFFTKISHEIQTPLTIITGPLQDMMLNAEKDGNLLLKQRLSIINHNAQRLSRIAFELTELRNKELNKMELRVAKYDLISDLKNIITSFAEQARFKKIDFIKLIPFQSLPMYYDKEKLEHVIYNLLSNAFKFTPSEGTITLEVDKNEKDNKVSISIKDTGIGIPKEDLEDIFKLFYRSESGINEKGSGIGLAFTKELIKIHEGEIEVQSSEDGTCFTITLPLSQDVSSSSVIVEENVESVVSEHVHDSQFSTKMDIGNKPDRTVLIVEDDPDMQLFLNDIFSNYYTTLIASNGKEGVLLAEKKSPDIIISDVMMSVMDGIEMCKKLQSSSKTAHIPIILLTASNTSNTKILGLQSGAIEYINKPFNVQEVLLKVSNLLNAKDKMIAKAQTASLTSPKETDTKSKDDIFMANLVEILNSQISNPKFKLEDLSSSMNMSYSVIYRKHHAITGKTLVEFFRQMRLKKALVLIVKSNYSISEASFLVGFNDPLYFSKCFKKEFGKSPKMVQKEALKKGVEKYVDNLMNKMK